jgi:hypothetical protein
MPIFIGIHEAFAARGSRQCRQSHSNGSEPRCKTLARTLFLPQPSLLLSRGELDRRPADRIAQNILEDECGYVVVIAEEVGQIVVEELHDPDFEYGINERVAEQRTGRDELELRIGVENDAIECGDLLGRQRARDRIDERSFARSHFDMHLDVAECLGRHQQRR